MRAAIRAAAAAAWPAECCGALVGVADNAGGTKVACALPASNEAEDTLHAFRMGPEAVRELEAAAAEQGAEVVGYYHSHPEGAGAAPSATDLEWALPGLIYVIAGAEGHELRAWRLREDRSGFDELTP
ncbi:MAG: Mov34/MPN/PAD-1 family protein [Gemmatimonadota bacterium]